MRPLLFIVLLLVASCKCPKQAADSGSTAPSDKILTRILYDAYGGTEEEGLEIIRSAKEMQALFARINRTRKPGLPVPDVDFQTQQAVVYYPGKGRDDTEIVLVRTKSDSGVVLQAGKRKTADAEGSAAVIVPVLLYTMPRTEGPVSLEE